MKAIHRGHEITVTRSDCMAGYSMLYYGIIRLSDGWECTSGYTEDASTVRQYVGYMKERVDAELEDEDPWGEKANAWGRADAQPESVG